jgi:Ca-activated chloride channel homolog
VSSDPAADTPLVDALQSPDLEVRVTGVEGFPDSLAALQSYDSLVLCNVAGGDLGRDQQNLLETAVRDFGIGLVCIGGDQAYAAGAYRGTPLANVLPVEVELSSKRVLPPGALVLVIDKSGSMSGEKIEMARQGAAAALQALASSDFVGVIAFDAALHIGADIQRVGDRSEIFASIMGIAADGGTVMYPAMAGAHEMLRRVTASLKHCVVLTDGISMPDDFEQITKAMVADRITVSTVGIGRDFDADLLQMIAAVGQGRFYPVPSPGQLPQIFLQETAVVLKSAINEEPFVPQLVASSELVRGIAVTESPQLLGHVSTESKPRAETPLLTHTGDPLLAHWQYGLGRAVAFTSDARARWARDWMGWDQYRPFWRQVVNWSLRRLESADFIVRVSTGLDEGRVSVEAFDAEGSFRNFLDLQSTIVGPDGRRQTVELRQAGPGFYEGTFGMHETGMYLLALLQIENGQPRPVQVVGASRNDSPEHDSSGPNLSLLHRISELTGGKVLDPTLPTSNPFYNDRRRTWQPQALWESLLKLAILLFVLDVGIRRLNPDPDDLKKAVRIALGVACFWRRTSSKTSSSEPSLATLLARREEVRTRQFNQPTPFDRHRSPSGSPSLIPRPPAASDPGTGGARTEATTDASESGEEMSTASRLLAAKRHARRTR